MQTGQLWQKQGEHEMAEGCFAAAMAHAGRLAEACASTAVPDARRQQLVDSLSTLYTSRAQAAWALQQEVFLTAADTMLFVRHHCTCRTDCPDCRHELYAICFASQLTISM